MPLGDDATPPGVRGGVLTNLNSPTRDPKTSNRSTKADLKDESKLLPQQQRRSLRQEDLRRGDGRGRLYSRDGIRDRSYSGPGGRGGFGRRKFNSRQEQDTIADRLAVPAAEPHHHHASSSRGHYRLRSQSFNHHRNFQPHQRLNPSRHYNPRRNAGHSPNKRRRKPLPAPFNSNEFLMAECKSPNYELIMEQINKNHSRGGGDADPPVEMDDGEEYYSSPDDEGEFLSQQFSETYSKIQAERLNTLTKNDLVREYMSLEGQVDDLTKQLRATAQTPTPTANNQRPNQRDLDGDMLPDSSRDIYDEKESGENEGGSSPHLSKEEIRRLWEENRALRRENMRLRTLSDGSDQAPSSSTAPNDG